MTDMNGKNGLNGVADNFFVSLKKYWHVWTLLFGFVSTSVWQTRQIDLISRRFEEHVQIPAHGEMLKNYIEIKTKTDSFMEEYRKSDPVPRKEIDAQLEAIKKALDRIESRLK